MSLWHLFLGILLVKVAVSQDSEDPICVQQACPPPTTCRVIKECISVDSCVVKAKCLLSPPQWSHTGVCQIGQPILEYRKGLLDDLTCYSSQPCPENFYCNTELQDTYSVCCRSDPTNAVRNGSCPASTNTDTSYCLDTCNNDGDCRYDYKCCKDGCSRQCLPPKIDDPCDTKTCPGGSRCQRPSMPKCTAPGTCWQVGDCVPCPPQCRMYCEHGKERDENGCEVCKCKPPPPFPRTRPPLPSAQNVLPSSQANQNTNTNVYGGGTNQRPVSPRRNVNYQTARNPFNNWFWMHMMNNFFF